MNGMTLLLEFKNKLKAIYAEYSFAILIAVKISSLAWACALRGICLRITGINASIFISNGGFLVGSSPAASTFAAYSFALNSIFLS